MKKNNEAIYLPIFLDRDGKRTYQSHRIELEEVDGKKKQVIVKNDKCLEDGEQLIQPMNRKAKRTLESRKR